MRRAMLVAVATAVASAAPPAVAMAALVVTFTPLCDSVPQQPYGVTLLITGLSPGAAIDGQLRWARGSFGPGGGLHADANGRFSFPLTTSSPLGVVTVDGYEDVDQDGTQDPGDPTFSGSTTDTCARPPMPGGSVSGSIDIVLGPMFGSTPRHVTIDARSGPVGQNPTGTVRIGTVATGAVTCVAVKGKTATLGVRFDPTLPGGVTAALIDVIDYEGFPGAFDDNMSFEAVPSAPTQCPFPISASGFRLSTNGQVTVTPAPPPPTSKDQCKDGGWRGFGGAFKSQGQCVAFVARGPKP